MEEKQDRKLQLSIEQTKKLYGNDIIKPLNSLQDINKNIISTGIEELDRSLGTGGVYKGSILEIFGPESVGKTALALHIAKQYQKMNLPILYINSERTLTKETVKIMGTQNDMFYVSDTNVLEIALDICIKSADIFGLIIIDSLSGLILKEQLRGDVGDNYTHQLDRTISNTLPMLIQAISRNRCTLIFITQLRDKVGVIFGNPEESTGGRALRHYSTVRLDMRRIETLKENRSIIGNKVRTKVVKNKISAPLKEAEFDILFGSGIKEN